MSKAAVLYFFTGARLLKVSVLRFAGGLTVEKRSVRSLSPGAESVQGIRFVLLQGSGS